MPELIGQSVERLDGREKVTGAAKYPSDLSFPDMLYLKLARSTQAHALISSIDISALKGVKGVYVFTAEDVPNNSSGSVIKDQPVFCQQKVRFYGEPLALVAAPSEEMAEKMMGKIKVCYQPLEVVSDPEAALKDNAPLVHSKGNLLRKISFAKGNIESCFAESSLVVADTFELPMVDHLPLETEAGVSFLDKKGILTLVVGTQNPFFDQQEVSRSLSVPLEKIRVKTLWTGGAFGGKDGNTVQLYLALATWKTGRPAKLVFTRRESLITSYKRHPARIYAKIGLQTDGRIKAFQGRAYFDTGAYAGLGPAVLALAFEHFAGPYRIENVKLDGYLVYTNKPPASALRGFGAPQVLFATETLLNRGAKKLGIDPIDLRLKNALEEGSKNSLGNRMEHSVGFKQTLRMLKESPLWQEKQNNQDQSVSYGMAAGYLSCGLGAGISDQAKVEIEKKDQKYLVKVGTVEIGQGMVTVLAQIAAQALGVSLNQIEIIFADTDRTYDCGTTAGSRSTYICGNAIIKAAHNFLSRGGKIGVGEVTFPASKRRDLGVGLPHMIYSFLAQAVKLKLNPLTGAINLLDIFSVTETGQVINQSLLDGQIQGAGAMAVGYALMENMDFIKGRLEQKDLTTYLIPTTKDICDIKNVSLETREPSGPFGAKGAGEVAIVALAPAIAAAVSDHYDLRLNRLPISREEVVKQLREKRVID